MGKHNGKLSKLVDLLYFITLDYNNLPRRIVDGIKLYFGYNAVYVVYQKNAGNKYSICELYGDNTYARDHMLYKEIWVEEDVFFQNLARMVNESKTFGKCAWRCQDFGCSIEEFWETKLGKAIRKGGFGYKAAITCGQPWHNMQHAISLYKPEEKGDYTEEEMELFNCIGKLFAIIQHHYREKIETEQLKNLLNTYITNMSSHFCITNSQFQVIFQTNSFALLAKEIFDGKVLRNTLMPLVAQMDEDKHLGKMTREYESITGKYLMQITSFNMDNNYIYSYRLQPLYMIEFEEIENSTARGPENSLISGKDEICFKASDAYSLTRREQEVLLLMLEGLSTAEISENLCIAETTARTHISNIYKKLEVNNRAQATAKILAELGPAEGFHQQII